MLFTIFESLMCSWNTFDRVLNVQVNLTEGIKVGKPCMRLLKHLSLKKIPEMLFDYSHRTNSCSSRYNREYTLIIANLQKSLPILFAGTGFFQKYLPVVPISFSRLLLRWSIDILFPLFILYILV